MDQPLQACGECGIACRQLLTAPDAQRQRLTNGIAVFQPLDTDYLVRKTLRHDVGGVHVSEAEPVALFVAHEQLPFGLLVL